MPGWAQCKLGADRTVRAQLMYLENEDQRTAYSLFFGEALTLVRL